MKTIYGLQKWSTTTEDCNDDCHITLEYDNTTLTLQTTLHQLTTFSATFFIRLYSTDNDTRCQWLEIYRDETICIQSVLNICPQSDAELFERTLQKVVSIPFFILQYTSHC